MRVLFVSKPVVPPWNDGSKNLVRDIATHLARARPTVLTTAGAPPLGPRVNLEPIYRTSGGFAPALSANARVVARLLTGDAHDLWHFVFAPNRASSTAAELAITARRAMGWRGSVVQTVASPPLHFRDAPRMLFGDRIVAQSEWMRARLVGAGAHANDLRVIPPCASAPAAPAAAEIEAVRARYRLGAGPVFVYPGDYEISTAAMTVARAAPAVLRVAPGATFVFSCRAKTPRAADARAAVESEAATLGVAERVIHVGEIRDFFALLALANAVPFPLDDLYGKVDLPMVVLEAMALGVPVVLARGGPLESVEAARFVEPSDPEALANELLALVSREETARELGERGRREYEARYTPRVVAAQYEALYAELS